MTDAGAADPTNGGNGEDSRELAPAEPEEALEPDQVLDPTTRRAVQRLIREEASYYSGPMPQPQMLRGYEDVVTGSAERIINWAETEANHRRALERTVVQTEARNASLGLVFAFIIALIVVGGGIALAATGHGLVGFGTLVTGLAGLVGAFLYRESRTPSALPQGDGTTEELRRQVEDQALPPGEQAT